MQNIKQLLESLLFIAGRPLSEEKLSEILHVDRQQVKEAMETLMGSWNTEERGIHIMKTGQSYQMVTNPNTSHIVKDFIKSEQTGDLTKPALETLTIIAYRGPITKMQLEQIRGVNCSLILRNLLIRGLIDSHEHKDSMQTTYEATFEFLKFLGVHRVEELPEFDRLKNDESLVKFLAQRQQDQQKIE